jgi:hypothetical protein
VTLAVVAWGYLVYAAIDFGGTARGGDARAWGFLALASAGAVACLFVGLMLISRLLQRLGITQGSSPTVSVPAPRRAAGRAEPEPGPTETVEIQPAPWNRPAGGRRAAR